jgi:hypothetical protein
VYDDSLLGLDLTDFGRDAGILRLEPNRETGNLGVCAPHFALLR